MRPIRCGIIIIALAALALLPAAGEATAGVANENDLDAFLPQQDMLETLKAKINTDPLNHDNYFAYAQLAGALGKPDQVAWAYEQLLRADPGFDRARLDLSLVYMQMKRYDAARAQLNTVLAKNPPAMVQQNIRTVLARIDEAERRHHISASLTVGIASDSNPSAEPNSGNILVFDTVQPLAAGAQAKKDVQEFTTVTLGDIYDIPDIANDYAMHWQTSAATYDTRQQQLSDLNVQLYNIRTGPDLIYKPLGVRLSLLAGYNYLTLDQQRYLSNPSAEFTAEFPFFAGLQGWIESETERRQFHNSDTISTYTDRTGNAWQSQFGLRYPFSEHSLWETAFTARRENANATYWANDQAGVTVSNTYSFPHDMAGGALANFFTIARAGYTDYRYDEPDPLISAKTRNDSQRSVQFTLGRKFDHDFILSAAYSFTDELSNLENYRYDNHRYMLSLTKNFGL